MLSGMKLFIFDLGSVIITGLRILPGMAEDLGLDYKTFHDDYVIYNRPLLDGWMSPDDYYRHLELKFGRKVTSDLFVDNFSPVVNTSLLEKVDALRGKGYRCVIGSNVFDRHWDYTLNMEENPLGHFDRLYASHLIHRSKPELYFFQHIQEEEGVPFDEIAFIDDRKENTDAAESLGITCLLYSGDGLPEREEAFFAPYLS